MKHAPIALRRTLIVIVLAAAMAGSGCRAENSTSGAGDGPTWAPATRPPDRSSNSAPAATSPSGSSSSGASSPGTSPSVSTTAARTTKLPPGPIVVVALGDSLTVGLGDEKQQGFPGRLPDALEDRGRPGSTVVNLGKSGWTSQMLIEGAGGQPPELRQALDAAVTAKGNGQPVLATLLIGTNDLWFLYNNRAPTTADDEKRDLDRYRANLQYVVSRLRAEGIRVILGVPDDQTRRPLAKQAPRRLQVFPEVLDGELPALSAQAGRYADVVRRVAAENDTPVADFSEATFFTDPTMLAGDQDHPNEEGYDEMAKVWLAAMQPLL